MNPTFKRLTPLLGLLVLLAGCGKAKNPVAPVDTTPLSSVTLSLHADTLEVGQTRQFTATALDTLGAPYTGALHWASSDAGVFTVSGTGFVRAVGEGTALLVVSGGGKADTARVLVYPVTSGWVVQTSNATEDLYDVFFDGAGRRGWAVGSGGLILSTSDAGDTWTRQTPTSATLRGVWFTGTDDGWAVGTGGTLLHYSTVQGVTAWRLVTSAATIENLMDVYFATPDTGWVVGGNGLLMTTRNHGVTWSKVNRGGVTLNGVMFAGTQDGWAVGEGGIVVGTHDRGASWFTVQPSVTGQPLKGIWRRSVERAVAVGAQGVVPATEVTADSVAWTMANAGSLYQLEGVCFVDSTAGFAVGWNGTAGCVIHSSNDGVTWDPQVVTSQFRLHGVFFVDARRGWVVGENGIIRHTATGGL
jgi:photosystem II stability/assembly factor-like uncharacterized protein